MDTNKKGNNWFYTIGFMAVVTITTLFLRLPTPTGGYFNFGDVAVVFTALLLGSRAGFIAGGLGSAIADLISGYAMFAPITFVAKGLEGLISGLAKNKKGLLYHLFPLLGALTIIPIYFFGEWILPQVGYPAAVAELLPNTIQAIGGYIGGKFLFEVYSRMIKE